VTRALRADATGAPLDRSEHAGLLLQRWLEHAEFGGGEKPNLAALHQRVIRCRVPEIYSQAFARWERGVTAPTRGRVLVQRAFRADSPLLIGLGQHTVLENGLALHHTYGVPYLPGSALKGLAARAARSRGDLDEGVYEAIFGNQDECGAVVFHDALLKPSTSPERPLMRDVLNPHHMEYYGGRGAPSETDSPIPTHLVAVRPGTEFLVVLEGLSDTLAWTQWCLDTLLREALQEMGVGAKTFAGYGRLCPAEKRSRVSRDDPAAKYSYDEDFAPFWEEFEAVEGPKRKKFLSYYADKVVDLLGGLDVDGRQRAASQLMKRPQLKKIKPNQEALQRIVEACRDALG